MNRGRCNSSHQEFVTQRERGFRAIVSKWTVLSKITASKHWINVVYPAADGMLTCLEAYSVAGEPLNLISAEVVATDFGKRELAILLAGDALQGSAAHGEA
jgi:hypothetical protein